MYEIKKTNYRSWEYGIWFSDLGVNNLYKILIAHKSFDVHITQTHS
jgi:hypothetical protein